MTTADEDEPPRPKYRDFPLDEIVERVGEIIKNPNATVFQKFTCDSCHSRQTIDTPNKIFLKGHCENCGYVTDILAKGCNYTVMFTHRLRR